MYGKGDLKDDIKLYGLSNERDSLYECRSLGWRCKLGLHLKYAK